MHDSVKDYYGKTLQSTDDLKTSACCDADAVPAWLKPLLKKIHPEVLSRYYGCGLVAPEQLAGCRVLDLGSGSGRDVYALAQLVGETGQVIGVDMTEAQMAIARQHRDFHRDAFGYGNVDFRLGYIEKLDELDLEAGSFDVIVSNCVVNLSPDKPAVLQGVARLLKPGGEFYFSDVYADRRVPDKVRNDPVLYGECLGGALYWADFLSLAKATGFADPRLVSDKPIDVTDPALAAQTEGVRFFSATWRLFKLDGLDAGGEDYGQAVTYRGTLAEQPAAFALDKHHRFVTGQRTAVSGNTWRLLADSRLAPHFTFSGDFSRHHGPFAEGGPGSSRLPFDTAACCAPASGGGRCC